MQIMSRFREIKFNFNKKKSKFLKNSVGTDTWKITTNLSTHDTLLQIEQKIAQLEKFKKIPKDIILIENIHKKNRKKLMNNSME